MKPAKCRGALLNDQRISQRHHILYNRNFRSFPVSLFPCQACINLTSVSHQSHISLTVLSSSVNDAFLSTSSAPNNLNSHLPYFPPNAEMPSATLPRLLSAICLSLLIVSPVSAQTVAPSNATSNTSVEFLLSTTLNQMTIQSRIVPLTNGAGLSGSLSQLEVGLTSHLSLPLF